MKRSLAAIALAAALAGPAAGQGCSILGTEVICSNEMAIRIAANPTQYASLVVGEGGAGAIIDSVQPEIAAPVKARPVTCQPVRPAIGCN